MRTTKWGYKWHFIFKLVVVTYTAVTEREDLWSPAWFTKVSTKSWWKCNITVSVFSAWLGLHYMLIISHLWLISHLRGTLFPLDTGTPGTSREDTLRMPMGDSNLQLAMIRAVSFIMLRGNKKIIPVVGGSFLTIFLAATTGIPESVVNLK